MGYNQGAMTPRDLEARRAYDQAWRAGWTPEQKDAARVRLNEWRKNNPKKYQAQRAKYADKYAESRRKWREKNRSEERQAALARRRASLAHRIAKRYGVGIAAAHEIVAQQPLACEICGTETRLHFDHCHATGKHRGWLCPRCNHGLGHFRDDPDRLRAAIAYLKERG